MLQATMHNIGSRLDSDLQDRAKTLHANDAVISKQEANLISATKKLTKDTDKLKIVADKGLKALKDAGNLHNFSEVLDRDLLILEETLRLVREGDESSVGESEGDWESCRVCRVEGKEDRIVLCDGNRDGERCDGPFHVECLGLKEMPKGPWYCSGCRAQNAAARRDLGVNVEERDLEGDVEMGGMEELVHDSRFDTPAAVQQKNGAWS